MAVRFLKKVQVANARLTILYYTLTCITVSLLVVKFIIGSEYIRIVDITSDVQVQLFIDEQSIGELKGDDDAWRRYSMSPLCSDPRRYDYWWDASGNWAYTEHECASLCSMRPSAGCIGPMDLFKRNSNREIFMVTQRQLRVYSAENATLIKVRNQIIPSVEALTLGVVFGVAADEQNVFGYKRGKDHRISGSSSTNIDTTILDASGHPWKTIPAGSPISLTLPQLLLLSGHADALDAVHEEAGRNMLPNASIVEGPIGRISGFNLVVHVKCYNYAKSDLGLNQLQSVPVCTLSVDKSAIGWSSMDTVYNRLGTEQHLQQHGVNILAQTGGKLRFVNISQIILALTTFMVFMDLPRQFVGFITEHCLGTLSKVYRQATCEYFNVQEQLTGLIMRMMAFSAVFPELEDIRPDVDASMHSGCISQTRMVDRLQAILHLEGDGLNSGDVHTLAGFCYHSAATCVHRSRSKFSAANAVLTEVRSISKRRLDDEGQAQIRLSNFNAAVSSAERVDLLTVLDLFSQSRKRSCLERFLTPKELNMYMATSCGQQDIERQLPVLPCNHETGGNLQGSLDVDSLQSSKLADSRLEVLEQSLRRLEDEFTVIKLSVQEEHASIRKALLLVHDQDTMIRSRMWCQSCEEHSRKDQPMVAQVEVMPQDDRHEAQNLCRQKQLGPHGAHSVATVLRDSTERQAQGWQAQAQESLAPFSQSLPGQVGHQG